MARNAISRSADGATIMALLPPSSRMHLPKRAATFGPTTRPMRVEPVAETIATSRFATMASPTSDLPISTCDSACGAPSKRLSARSKIFCVANADNGVFSDGFHITGSPQTIASAAFQHHGATGKLNAVTMPHTPAGCHVSRIE